MIEDFRTHTILVTDRGIRKQTQLLRKYLPLCAACLRGYRRGRIRATVQSTPVSTRFNIAAGDIWPYGHGLKLWSDRSNCRFLDSEEELILEFRDDKTAESDTKSDLSRLVSGRQRRRYGIENHLCNRQRSIALKTKGQHK